MNVDLLQVAVFCGSVLMVTLTLCIAALCVTSVVNTIRAKPGKTSGTRKKEE